MDHHQPVERVDLRAAVATRQGLGRSEPSHRHRRWSGEGTVSPDRTLPLEHGRAIGPQGPGAANLRVTSQFKVGC